MSKVKVKDGLCLTVMRTAADLQIATIQQKNGMHNIDDVVTDYKAMMKAIKEDLGDEEKVE